MDRTRFETHHDCAIQVDEDGKFFVPTLASGKTDVGPFDTVRAARKAIDADRRAMAAKTESPVIAFVVEDDKVTRATVYGAHAGTGGLTARRDDGSALSLSSYGGVYLYTRREDADQVAAANAAASRARMDAERLRVRLAVVVYKEGRVGLDGAAATFNKARTMLVARGAEVVPATEPVESK